jgi:hypothetical protein
MYAPANVAIISLSPTTVMVSIMLSGTSPEMVWKMFIGLAPEQFLQTFVAAFAWMIATRGKTIGHAEPRGAVS